MAWNSRHGEIRDVSYIPRVAHGKHNVFLSTRHTAYTSANIPRVVLQETHRSVLVQTAVVVYYSWYIIVATAAVAVLQHFDDLRGQDATCELPQLLYPCVEDLVPGSIEPTMT